MPNHIAELYARCGQAYNREPKDGEFDAWESVLSHYSHADIDAAIRRWQNETFIEEWTQRPRGARMPSAVELKLSIDRFDAANRDEFEPCNKDGCSEGWIREFSGLTNGSTKRQAVQVDPKVGAVRRCHCFTEWAGVRRERKAQKALENKPVKLLAGKKKMP